MGYGGLSGGLSWVSYRGWVFVGGLSWVIVGYRVGYPKHKIFFCLRSSKKILEWC